MTPRILLVSALMVATAAHATGNHPPKAPPSLPSPPPASAPLDVTQSATAAAGAAAQATSSSSADLQATLTGSATAAGGSVGPQSFEQFSRSNMYVLPAPVQAAPLPPGLCPQGDSMSVGILWNLFSYSRSSTRSEMECLRLVLEAFKAQPTVHVIQAPQLPPAPPAPACVQPKKRSATKTAKPAADSCKVTP